jgi:4-hydroxybenzoate polyprenyltransferase
MRGGHTKPHPTMTLSPVVRPSSPLSLDFWQAYGILMRPYLLFVSGITGIAGLAVVTELETARLFYLLPVFFLAYGFGQALTDCFQMDTDALSAPYRPLIQGRVRRSDVLAVSLGGLAASGLALAVATLWTLPLAALCVVGLATYTGFKRRWWAGPFYNAWIVAALFVLAVIAGSGGLDLPLLVRTDVLLAATVVFFGYANFVLAGYFKDVSADRATGYETLPVRYGLHVSRAGSDVFALAAVLATGLLLLLLPGVSPLAIAFAVAGGVASAAAQVRLHRVRCEEQAHEAIAPVVHAYILLLSSIAVAHRADWFLPLALLYAGFVLVLRRRPARNQI